MPKVRDHKRFIFASCIMTIALRERDAERYRERERKKREEGEREYKVERGKKRESREFTYYDIYCFS